MNLDRFYLPQFANTSTSECGIDSLEECNYKKLFIKFPYKVEYNYNSKGYRDTLMTLITERSLQTLVTLNVEAFGLASVYKENLIK